MPCFIDPILCILQNGWLMCGLFTDHEMRMICIVTHLFSRTQIKSVFPKQLPLVAWTFMWVSFHNPMTPCDSNQVHEWLATFKLLGPGAFVWWWPQPWAGVRNGATNWVVMIIFGVGCAMNGSYEYAWLIEDWDLGGDLDEARLEHCRVFSTVLFQPSFWIIRCSGMSAFSRDLIDWIGTSPFSHVSWDQISMHQISPDRLLEVKPKKKTSVPNVILYLETTQGVKIQANETLAPFEIASFCGYFRDHWNPWHELYIFFFGWVISWPQQLRHPGHGGWTGARSNHQGWRITQRRPWTWAQCAESQDNVQSGGLGDAKVAILCVRVRWWDGSNLKQPTIDAHFFQGHKC